MSELQLAVGYQVAQANLAKARGAGDLLGIARAEKALEVLRERDIAQAHQERAARGRAVAI